MLRQLRPFASLILVLALLLSLLPPRVAVAADPAPTEEEAIEALQEYLLVRGDPSGDLHLDRQLTRAEAAALFVRAMGAEDLAKALQGAVPFWDAQNHWAAGEITMAARLNLMKGDGYGSFRPDDSITYAEILTVLLRMVNQEPSGTWNPAVITAAAKELGIAPSGVRSEDAASRRKIFWALYATVSNVTVEGNQTLLRKHFDKTPPTLSVDRVDSPTEESSITISGTAIGANRVLVDGKAAKLDRKTGRFSETVSLDLGPNTIVVRALDPAKNESVKSVTVERRGDISRITIEGPALIETESSARLTITATDARGTKLPLDGIEASLSGDVATFDLDRQTLTTGSKVGRGTLTLRAGNARGTITFDVRGPSEAAAALVIGEINKGVAPALNKETTVTVSVVDSNGKVVADDYFRKITLKASDLTGVTITPSTADTVKGVATFTIKSSREGMATLTATSSGLDAVERQVQFLAGTRVVLSTTARDLKPDGTSTATIRATLTDEDGKTITNNSNQEIQIELEADGDGDLTDSYVSIPRGKSNSSGNDGTFQVGIVPGTVTISGEIVSDHKYSVQSLVLPVDDPLGGSKFQLSASPSNPEPGETVTLTLKVVDSSNRTVTAGSYAFQLSLSTSNEDPVENGFPEGVSLTFEDSDYYPVDDGQPENDSDNDPYSIVGRTYRGTAVMTLRYTRSGTVTVKPVLKPATYEAYHPDTGVGAASPSTGLYAPEYDINFAGDPAGIALTVDSDLGKGQPAGAFSGAEDDIKVYAQVVDDFGTPIPGYRQSVTLTRESGGDGISSIVGLNRKTTSDGQAEFEVKTSNTEGYDLYTASIGTLKSQPLLIAVRKEKPPTPYVVAIRGVKEGDLSPENGRVGPEHDYMQIQLEPQASVNPAEPGNWVVAKVYRKGESRPFYTSDAFDLLQPVPMIRVPRGVLKTGEYYYEVVVNNGVGDSPRSPALDETAKATVIDSTESYQLTSAQFDAGTCPAEGDCTDSQKPRLVLSGKGFSSKGLFFPEKIRLVKDDDTVGLTADKVEVVSITSSTITLRLEPSLAEKISPDRFFGDVYLEADYGWYTNADETLVAEAYDEIPVKPMATITYAALDAENERLYLYGEGLKQGTPDLSKIHINGGGEPVTLRSGSSSSYDRVTSHSDSQLIITLSTATLDKILALEGPDRYVTADSGWIYSGTSSSRYRVGAITGAGHLLYKRVSVSRLSYDKADKTLTITGSGFEGATIDPERLVFRSSSSSSATQWKPSSTDPVTAESDTTFIITFSDADADAFVKSFTAGRNVFMNTDEGWLELEDGWEAVPIPDYSAVFTMPK